MAPTTDERGVPIPTIEHDDEGFPPSPTLGASSLDLRPAIHSPDVSAKPTCNPTSNPSSPGVGADLTFSKKYLPLRELTLNSRPLVKRAIQFSCDGDLAVAADDSVHVFVPEFPDLTRRRKRIAEGGDPESSDEEETNEQKGKYNPEMFRTQYSEGSKHMPVSFPPLDPRINKELYDAEGMPFPYDKTSAPPKPQGVEKDTNGQEDGRDAGDGDQADGVEGDDDDDWEDDSDDSSVDDDPAGGGARLGSNQPYGAGSGPITSVGSSMNHVVKISWSPSELGVNRRPILGILTGAGTLAMYGDGDMAANVLGSANGYMLQRRELASWLVLWGVGERMMVPGQSPAYSEYIRTFAWAQEIGPGQALLATLNDAMEIAIISVQTVVYVEEVSEKGRAVGGPAEKTVWHVRELVRFKAEGPHLPVSTMDPDYVPCGTSFGLSFGPWLEDDGGRTCVLGYLDRNYVGFRKLRIDKPWTRGQLPKLQVENKDTHGQCVHLTTDGFIEFEQGIFHKGDMIGCRGMISTGWHPVPFEVSLASGALAETAKHKTGVCGTTYNLQHCENPIIDMVVHPPPDPARPTPTPLYTLVRLSATPTTPNWYETNVPSALAADSNSPYFQWARSIQQKLEVLVPADMYQKRAYGADDSDSDEESDDGVLMEDTLEDDEGVNYTGEGLTAIDLTTDANVAREVKVVPEVHPHRFRFHGLTLSAGGGASAVLVSAHSTQHPERGGWHTQRSQVLFSYKPRRASGRSLSMYMDDDNLNFSLVSSMSTEGKLFEYLYGGGPDVPGVHYPLSSDPRHAHVAQIFAPVVRNQKCEVCGAAVTQSMRKEDLVGCEKGHFFGICALSGLAVQKPGMTRSCGTCGFKTMRPEILLQKVPEDIKEEVKGVIGRGSCMACSGKFLN
ncbi:hypothetical protein QC763_609350 [Podospora pseudopauciseta]|uniref:Transcription factor IIIC 90kDa subunit N-terminal domain-containing protein n=1 Tax=Podospora pseudopauciseta TaxID=2093780 RepID=A0ABR0H6N4_9PEZI|nr:hypothetical protein QC763_609350 [Podospora pseudopauciseta]